MIRSLIREKAGSKGVKNANQLGVLIKVTPNVSARLWKDDFGQIGKITLNKLCSALECNVGDLLIYEPDEYSEKYGRKSS